MGKRFIICAVIFVVLLGFGFWAYANLEIYPRKDKVSPSAETIGNRYLALERWLKETDHPVRVTKRGSPSLIAAGPEKTALVQADICDWKNAGKILMPWVEQGGFLVITLENSFYDEDLAKFLVSMGIRASNFPSENDDEEDEEVIDQTEEMGQEMLADIEDISDETQIPDFDWGPYFYVDESANAFTIKDSDGDIMLAQVPHGKGALTVTGRPRFMFNDYLDSEVNARLAWNLTGGQIPEDNPGLLIIRGKRVTKGLFGKLAERGNFIPLAVSVLLVIVLGFWMVIPVFGLVFGEKQRTARPIRERFLAETRFLEKYGALKYYLEIYERELKLKDVEHSLLYRDIIRRLRKYQNMTERL
ncbi:hypothetical protein AGMMS50293_21320 [Spirochaetia bacterium]|nr:hypothetical protein AGMMS50293_21320 [Spirochaetia bacterium]